MIVTAQRFRATTPTPFIPCNITLCFNERMPRGSIRLSTRPFRISLTTPSQREADVYPWHSQGVAGKLLSIEIFSGLYWSREYETNLETLTPAGHRALLFLVTLVRSAGPGRAQAVESESEWDARIPAGGAEDPPGRPA